MKLISVIKYLVVIFLFASMACDKVVQDQNFTIGTESTFHLNQLYTSTDGQYTFQIQEVNDSRCPEGVECFWAGEISLKGEWVSSRSKSSVELHTVLKNLQKEPDGFTIQLVDVKPYPKLGTESKSSELTVTLLIQKK